MANLDSLKKEYEELLNQLGDPSLVSDWEKFEKLSKRKNFLEKVLEKEKEIKELRNEIEENKMIIAGKEDAELISLAETESAQLKEKEKSLSKELETLLEEGMKPDSKTNLLKINSAIIEIRAGAGGEEAAIFASDLSRMYSKFAQSQNWGYRILDSHPSDLKGFKEIILELDGDNVFSKIQYEGGVHRVQRIPETEKSGRVHTSTASVAILPKPKNTEIKIRPDDLKTDFYCSSGPGGQYVNKRMTAVRITHLPSGLVVTSQTERNQLQNKENAMSILEARLLERRKTAEEEKISSKRRKQIGQAKRAEKIRTYNFPQDRLTDHRIKKNFHNLEKIMAGELSPIIEALQKSEATE